MGGELTQQAASSGGSSGSGGSWKKDACVKYCADDCIYNTGGSGSSDRNACLRECKSSEGGSVPSGCCYYWWNDIYGYCCSEWDISNGETGC